MRCQVGLILTATFLVASVSSGDPGKGIEASFDLTLRVTLGRDLGQTLGSLFEARDEMGRVVFGAGFNDAHSTYMRDHNRLVTFFYKGLAKTVNLTPIEKPFDANYNGVRLIVDCDNLLACSRVFSSTPLLRLTPEHTWAPYDVAWSKGITRFGGLQFVNDCRIVFEPNRAVLDGRAICTSENSGLMYYANGRFFFCQGDPQHLFMCDWDPESGNSIDFSAGQDWDIEGYPFVFGSYEDEVLLATNIGNVYVYSDGELRCIRESDGKSWQAYSILRLRDQLVIGHYPTGSLYVYDDEGLRLFEPAIPVPENALPNAREAQTLAVYCGDLYAGVWPWGELWRFDTDQRQWHFVTRVFEYPLVTKKVDAPFAKEMQGKSDDYNYWGQRITSLANFEDSLFIATMNKQGRPHKPDEHPFVDDKTLAQYGRVHKLTGNAQITAPFRWKPETEFRFVCENTRLAVYQDGALLGESHGDGKTLETRTVREMRTGNGVYGTFAGRILKVDRGEKHGG